MRSATFLRMTVWAAGLLAVGTPALAATTILRDGLGGYAGTTDSWLNYSSQRRNYGQSPELQGGYNNGIEENIVLRFSLAGLPVHQTITSATLKVYYFEGESFQDDNVVTLTPFRLTASWEEGNGGESGVYGEGVSWRYRDVAETLSWTGQNGGWNDKADDGCSNARIQGTNGTDPTAVKPSWPGAEVAFAVTPTVGKWYRGEAANNGFLIAATGFVGGGYIATGHFRSSEYADHTAYRPTLEIVHETAPITWTGATNGNWDTSTVNWTWAGGATTFASGDIVQFGESTRTAVNVVGTVTPASVTFNHSAATAYTLSGGSIGGTGGLTKAGAGTLTLLAGNAYTGTTAVNAGVLNVRHASALGTTAGGTTVAAGAALEVQGGVTVAGEGLTLRGSGVGGAGALRSRSGANVWTGAVGLPESAAIGVDADTLSIGGLSGNGGLTKAGAGTLVLAAANSHAGGTWVSAGTLRCTSAGALPAGRNVTVQNGALLDIGATSHSLAALTLTDGTIAGTSGVLQATSVTLSKGLVSAVLGGGASLTKAATADVVTLSGANAYAGSTQVLGGTLRLGAAGAIPDGSAVSVAGVLDLAGFNEAVGALSGGGAVSLGAGTLTLNVGAVAMADFAGVISDAGGLVKTGPGLQTLRGLCDFLGETRIDDGTLRLAGGGALSGSPTIRLGATGTFDVRDLGWFELAAGRTLTGAGTVLGSVDAHGTIAPGLSAGLLTVEDVALLDEAALAIELGGRERVLQYDVLAATGRVRLEGACGLDVSLLGLFKPVLGDEFDILDFADLEGEFADVRLPGLAPGLRWSTDDLYTKGVLRVLPEPGTLALVGAGLAASSLRRRRRPAA